MHGRIFQISTKPIHKDDYIEEDRYYDHWFVGSIANYVNGDTDGAEDLEWLRDCYEARGISFGADINDDGSNSVYLIVEDKSKYFAQKFESFQKTINELSTITLDDFVSSKCGMQMYNLKEAYDDKFGFYVDGDETSLETFDAFIRYAEVGTKYYIGATIDYHY